MPPKWCICDYLLLQSKCLIFRKRREIEWIDTTKEDKIEVDRERLVWPSRKWLVEYDEWRSGCSSDNLRGRRRRIDSSTKFGSRFWSEWLTAKNIWLLEIIYILFNILIYEFIGFRTWFFIRSHQFKTSITVKTSSIRNQ